MMCLHVAEDGEYKLRGNFNGYLYYNELPIYTLGEGSDLRFRLCFVRGSCVLCGAPTQRIVYDTIINYLQFKTEGYCESIITSIGIFLEKAKHSPQVLDWYIPENANEV